MVILIILYWFGMYLMEIHFTHCDQNSVVKVKVLLIRMFTNLILFIFMSSEILVVLRNKRDKIHIQYKL